ncbi:hypothetical protein ACFY8V_20510 [Streptomyces californicus]|uniref:hypothetical protein n=1 Tax=Streptomyces californicus TaxID=67351 RepID=UPI0036BD232E
MPDPVPDPVSVQPVVAPVTSTALFLVGTVELDGEKVVRDVLPDLAAVARSLGFRYPDAGLACVAGFGSFFAPRADFLDSPPPPPGPSAG